MKVLLDECLPRKLKFALTPHNAHTVVDMGWSGIKNGQLLGLAEENFDVFVTIDGNLAYQQNFANRSLSVIILAATDNSLDTLITLIPQVLIKLADIQSGQIIRIRTL